MNLYASRFTHLLTQSAAKPHPKHLVVQKSCVVVNVLLLGGFARGAFALRGSWRLLLRCCLLSASRACFTRGALRSFLLLLLRSCRFRCGALLCALLFARAFLLGFLRGCFRGGLLLGFMGGNARALLREALFFFGCFPCLVARFFTRSGRVASLTPSTK